VTRNKIDSKNDLASKDNAISIIVKDTKNKYLLLKEFRYAVNDYVVDFPAGLVDEGETLDKAAKRELFEETGLSDCDIISVYPGGFSSAGMTDERVAVCLVEVDDLLEQAITNKNTEGEEDIEYILCDESDLKDVVLGNYGKVSNRVEFFVMGLELNREVD